MSKIIISFSVGLIISQIAGNYFRVQRYYFMSPVSPKREITKELSKEYNSDMVKSEYEFNISSAITYGVTSSCSMLLILFGTSIIKKKEDVSVQ